HPPPPTFLARGFSGRNGEHPLRIPAEGSEAPGKVCVWRRSCLRVSKHSALVTGCGKERKADGAKCWWIVMSAFIPASCLHWAHMSLEEPVSKEDNQEAEWASVKDHHLPEGAACSSTSAPPPPSSALDGYQYPQDGGGVIYA
ncbi:unnamed protein product, partial [Gulo gulo]